MPILVGLILIFVAVVVIFWVMSGIVHLLLMLLMAGVIGWLADQIVPGRLPYGVLGAVVVGLVGSWLGGILLGNLGPRIFDIRVIPAFIGALALTAIVALLAPRLGGKAPHDLLSK